MLAMHWIFVITLPVINNHYHHHLNHQHHLHHDYHNVQGKASGCFVDQSKITYGEDVPVTRNMRMRIIRMSTMTPRVREKFKTCVPFLLCLHLLCLAAVPSSSSSSPSSSSLLFRLLFLSFLKQVTAYYLWLPYLLSVCFLLTRLPRFIIISNIISNIIIIINFIIINVNIIIIVNSRIILITITSSSLSSAAESSHHQRQLKLSYPLPRSIWKRQLEGGMIARLVRSQSTRLNWTR